MGDSQIVEAEAGLGPNQDPVDGTLRDDLERPVLPEKSESSSTPPISNLASVDVRALKKPKNIHRLMHTQRSPGTVRMTLPIPKLDIPAQMDSHRRRIRLHSHLVNLDFYCSACIEQYRSRITYSERIHLFALSFGLHSCIRLRSVLIGPLSEVYGRVLVLQLANLFYLIFNTACGFAHNTTQMVVFHFLAGLGGR
ncbi:hypothetical protein HO173_012860 [Letharia columbiana]|uniref:Uncharacterized protein n=1 Tax=Letharia columbiana TaxID=112416 RepID=A0A8H6FEB0_9LECA|nr:uncharacterized protein HO173_012860 [Letharia columbiana]KAF6224703.1 hypothetical protein HO173_012860 [Letharia columbiana]